ncbi:MAG: alpha-amylase [Candidatus Cloacimonetes bacterium]|nr:alpha-amylase [Candidatus Cloacimonadota bacterium]
MRSVKEIDLKALIENRQYFPSPEAWEDQILYFLLADRFSNGQERDLYDPKQDYEKALRDEKTTKAWQEFGDQWNGGNLRGIKSKIGYLKTLGITAIWISPLFKQVAFEDSYHGYGIQNFLEIDPHLGTKEDLKDLVEEAHEHGIYIILDIILNHTGNVFRYVTNEAKYNGNEFPVQAFHDQNGEPTIPFDNIDFDNIWPNGGIWPQELMRLDTFSRKGEIVNWDNSPEYLEGDFFSLKNINTGHGEYNNYQPSNALKVLTECFKYWIAFADLDGFRLDTVKHLEAGATRYFVREIHEFTETIGKNNFYVIGEITGGFEFAINSLQKTGIDAALGINRIPEKLENVAKGYLDPIEFFSLYKNSELLGEEEYSWYKDNVVTMFDDHDMVTQSGFKSRFCADKTTAPLLLNALFLNLMSPGIPCIYYGTEQGFDGSGEGDKYVREAMFGGNFGAFRTHGKHFFQEQHPVFLELAKIIAIRKANLALKQGRLYQREISYNQKDFALPHKIGKERHTGIIVWSRIISDEEIILAVNCDMEKDREVDAILDNTLHHVDEEFECNYSSQSAQIGSIVKLNQVMDKKVISLKVPQSGCVVYKKKDN